MGTRGEGDSHRIRKATHQEGCIYLGPLSIVAGGGRAAIATALEAHQETDMLYILTDSMTAKDNAVALSIS